MIESKSFKVTTLPFEQDKEYLSCASTDDYKKWLWVSQEQDAKDSAQILEQLDQTDLLIIDHYGLDKSWEQTVSQYAKKVLVIDDLANRQHDCDFLLDQNFYLNLEGRYDHLVPQDCIKLLGPHFALLGPEFIKIREARLAQAKHNCSDIKNILIFMGGADRKNLSKRIIELLISIPSSQQFHIDVIVGSINPHKIEIEQLCAKHSFLHYHCQPAYYHDLLIKADIAIAAGGVSLLERCCIGLLSLTISIAENQYQICVDMANYGAHIYLGTESQLDQVGAVLMGLMECNRKAVISKALGLVDGLGLDRIIKELS
jgi:UDP-2,4-diacetamido-2,4,6-trideoxy-beta-L-altropyranose hydrolase